jgi:hypothetical protein
MSAFGGEEDIKRPKADIGEPQIEAVQDFSREGAVLAILPRGARSRFKGCLP